jgi:catechol 2,3-dioxygenase-like lactoylglutathione lyase family enzyme
LGPTYNVRRGEPHEIGVGLGHIATTTPNLDKTVSRLRGRGVEPERPADSIREGGSTRCFVGDRDDYRIELIERG